MKAKHRLFLSALGFLSCGCVAFVFLMMLWDVFTETPAEAKKRQHEANVGYFTGVVEKIFYFKDPRTGLCFACCEGHQSLSITLVPCESVPADMLVVPRDAE